MSLNWLTNGGAAFDTIEFGLNHMTAEQRAELAWDLIEGKGERDLVARVAHQIRLLGAPVRREALRVDLVIADLKVEFKVCYPADILGSSTQQAKWGLGVFDKDLQNGKGDLFALRAGKVDLLVAAIPVMLDQSHAKYKAGRKFSPHEVDVEAADILGDLTEACRTWATGQDVVAARRAQYDLMDEQVGRVQLTMFGFVRRDGA